MVNTKPRVRVFFEYIERLPEYIPTFTSFGDENTRCIRSILRADRYKSAPEGGRQCQLHILYLLIRTFHRVTIPDDVLAS